MSSKKAMKQMQKLAFQKHKNNIRNNKFRPKTNKIFNKHKKWKNYLYTCFCFKELLSYILWEKVYVGWT